MLQFLIQSPAFKGLELHILTVAKKAEEQAAIAHLNEAEQKTRAAGFEPVWQLLYGETEAAITTYITEHNISLLLMGAGMTGGERLPSKRQPDRCIRLTTDRLVLLKGNEHDAGSSVDLSQVRVQLCPPAEIYIEL